MNTFESKTQRIAQAGNPQLQKQQFTHTHSRVEGINLKTVQEADLSDEKQKDFCFSGARTL